MKLLFENWRKYLKEQMAFGDKFETWLHNGACTTVRCLDQYGFLHMVSGGFRDVYFIPGSTGSKRKWSPHYVIKIALDDYAKKMNAQEVNNEMITRFPDLLPKQYDRAADYEWIIVERVRPFDEHKVAVVKEFFPAFMDIEFSYPIRDPWSAFELYSKLRVKEEKAGERNNRITDKLFDGNIDLQKDFETDLQRTSPFYNQLIQLAAEYDIAIEEIRGGNVGTKADGSFVLVDLSSKKHFPWLSSYSYGNSKK